MVTDYDSDTRKGAGQGALRFGILCRDTLLEGWQAACVRRLMALENLEPALLIRVGPECSPGPASVSNGSFLFRLYRRALARRAALKPMDLSPALARVPTLECTVAGGRGRYADFNEDDVGAVRAKDLDFILGLAGERLAGGMIGAARCGVWIFQHGDVAKYRGEPPCFWEIYNGDPVSGAALCRLTSEGRVVLKKGSFPTVAYSYGANLSRVLEESAVWPAQVCMSLLKGGRTSLDDPPSRAAPPAYGPPTNFQTARLWAKLAKNLAAVTFRSLFRHEQWNIGIVREPIDALLNENAEREVQWLPDPKRGTFLADPFGIFEGGHLHVLCEDYDYKSMRGTISHLQVSEGGAIRSKGPAFTRAFHMSYPYLVKHLDHVYCIPESSASGEVVLYKAERFPESWVKVATLIDDLPAVDVTVFEHDGRWWLACTNLADGRYYKLLLWHAPDIAGPWAPHPLNPVKLDITSSRPAGTPFTHAGSLYRPAQDCSRTYGGRVVINRVIELSTTAFAEEPAAVVEPDIHGPYGRGLHTTSCAGDVTLVDGKRYVFSVNAFMQAIRFLFTKLAAKRTTPGVRIDAY
ncbi:MAG: hypothetical protein WB783_17980 [Arenicellales bacterium]